MPITQPINTRVSHLISTYSKGGFEAAQIIDKGPTYYRTELEDIGPVYIMDDHGNAVCVSFNMMFQAAVHFYNQ